MGRVERGPPKNTGKLGKLVGLVALGPPYGLAQIQQLIGPGAATVSLANFGMGRVPGCQFDSVANRLQNQHLRRRLSRLVPNLVPASRKNANAPTAASSPLVAALAAVLANLSPEDRQQLAAMLSETLQPRSQVMVIVYFAIEHDRYITTLIERGLNAALRIHDCQPHTAQCVGTEVSRHRQTISPPYHLRKHERNLPRCGRRVIQ